jgi:hypothetical protein
MQLDLVVNLRDLGAKASAHRRTRPIDLEPPVGPAEARKSSVVTDD